MRHCPIHLIVSSFSLICCCQTKAQGRQKVNPFADGCLRGTQRLERQRQGIFGLYDDNLPSIYDKRMCNSDDKKGSEYCKKSSLDYMEIVIHNTNWDTGLMSAWILQIFLSEILGVPAKVGMDNDTVQASFYSPESAYSLSRTPYAWSALTKSNEVNGDCSITDEPCVNLLPEIWIGQQKTWLDFEKQKNIDQVIGNGRIGKISWFVPAFTSTKYPHLLTIHGLSNNREELARRFKRPSTWRQYCDEVSSHNCSTPDKVALRYPTRNEEEHYFVEDKYEGYFRYTSENNCTQNPSTCTGHIIGPPCTWSTYVDAQTYWNGIALESNGKVGSNNGYLSYQMKEIWRAAAAKEIDIIMWWWEPSLFAEEFHNTTAEFQPVLLPKATLACRKGRILPEDRCADNIMTRRGEKDGACDNEANILRTAIATSVVDDTFRNDEVNRSPAYDAIRNLKIDDLQIKTILNNFAKHSSSGMSKGSAARLAACDFVVSSQEELEIMIPRGYPRKVVFSNYSFVLYMSKVLACTGFLFVITISGAVFKYRKRNVFVYAQLHFVKMLLLGLLLMAAAGVAQTLEPSRLVCSLQVWLLPLGLTLQMVPLLVKVAAINKLMKATQKLRRIKIAPVTLYAQVALCVLFVLIFLITRERVDPPQRQIHRYLQHVESGPATVIMNERCGAELIYWSYISIGLGFLMFPSAAVLAFQSRNVKSEFNESKSLGLLVYTQFVFFCFGSILLIFFQPEAGNGITVNPQIFDALISILLILDVISATTIYFVPKLLKAKANEMDVCETYISIGSTRTGVATRRLSMMSMNDYSVKVCMLPNDMKLVRENNNKIRLTSEKNTIGSKSSQSNELQKSDRSARRGPGLGPGSGPRPGLRPGLGTRPRLSQRFQSIKDLAQSIQAQPEIEFCDSSTSEEDK